MIEQANSARGTSKAAIPGDPAELSKLLDDRLFDARRYADVLVAVMPILGESCYQHAFCAHFNAMTIAIDKLDEVLDEVDGLARSLASADKKQDGEAA